MKYPWTIAFLLGALQIILMTWIVTLRMEIDHKDMTIHLEQRRRMEWESIAKQWEENSNKFERVVRTYEGICGARGKR